MTSLIPDPQRSDTWLIASATDPCHGIQVGATAITNVHGAQVCVGRPCVIHNPSDHLMRDWPLNFRADRGLMERVCRHGVGHPDPDSLMWHAAAGREWQGIHGCDGCCLGQEAIG